MSGLKEHLKLAREYAVEGLYDTSVIFFDNAVAQINKHLNSNSVEDPLVRAKWMKVKKALCEETEVVKQLDAERRAFKETTRSPSQSSSFVFQPLDNYPTTSPPPPPPPHDPDVWRPPSPDDARRPTRPTARSKDGAWAARGSARPAPRAAKPNSRVSTGTGKKGKDNNKYEGPDGELAEMLERDVLETSPAVRWDDVAGLTQAKSLLEEALVLPLWMPEYFQVTFLTVLKYYYYYH